MQTFLSLKEFDQQLLESYFEFKNHLTDKPLPYIEQRFAEYGFSNFQWGLIELAEKALLQSDFEQVFAALSRFQNACFYSRIHFNEKGIHQPTGYDYSILVEPAIYASLIGKTFIRSAFPGSRKRSTASYPSFMHMANIILCLEHPQWPNKDKAIDNARCFITAKNSKKFEIAIITFFLNILDGDAETAAISLIEFEKHYVKSDWGRRTPFDRAILMQALARFAGFYIDNKTVLNKLSILFDSSYLQLWESFYKEKHRFNEYKFSNPLSFFNIF